MPGKMKQLSLNGEVSSESSKRPRVQSEGPCRAREQGLSPRWVGCGSQSAAKAGEADVTWNLLRLCLRRKSGGTLLWHTPVFSTAEPPCHSLRATSSLLNFVSVLLFFHFLPLFVKLLLKMTYINK